MNTFNITFDEKSQSLTWNNPINGFISNQGIINKTSLTGTVLDFILDSYISSFNINNTPQEGLEKDTEEDTTITNPFSFFDRFEIQEVKQTIDTDGDYEDLYDSDYDSSTNDQYLPLIKDFYEDLANYLDRKIKEDYFKGIRKILLVSFKEALLLESLGVNVTIPLGEDTSLLRMLKDNTENINICDINKEIITNVYRDYFKTNFTNSKLLNQL